MEAKSQDLEAKAIVSVVEVFNQLTAESQSNVLHYLNRRYGSGLAPQRNFPFGQANSGDAVSQFSQFETVADACAAASPNSPGDRALVVATFIQLKEGLSDFAAQDVNRELKHLGHPVANITETLQSLINQRPQLIIQVAKKGSTKQGRKKYKVTEAGLQKVYQMVKEARQTNVERTPS